jgi:hypothetical protein
MVLNEPAAPPKPLHGADGLSDARLVAEVAEVVRVPRVEAADSMVLHAPLELAARLALLPHVPAARRAGARDRVADLARAYVGIGPGVEDPRAVECSSVPEGARLLADAIAAGDLDDVDALAAWLGRAATPGELRTHLADAVLPRLAAAAHAPIFLFLLPRVAPRGELTGELLRPLARELARAPDWNLTWYQDRPPRSATPGDALLDAVRGVPQVGLPGSDFIFPVMHQIEASGIATELLAGPTRSVSVADGGRVLLRAAAWSMLGEPDAHRPYGWSHCLTMPQAVLGIASACDDPSAALAVAATYVAGFRAAFAAEPLSTGYEPADPGLDVAHALLESPEDAAAAVWHSPSDALADAVTVLAGNAATHHDQHLVKYTLACLDAAAWDRTFARLYLAAAASLAGYWSARSGGAADRA